MKNVGKFVIFFIKTINIKNFNIIQNISRTVEKETIINTPGSKSSIYCFAKLFNMAFFSLLEKNILNSIHRDLIVFDNLYVLLLIIKKKVLLLGSSKDFNKAFDELKFKYSALSINTILIPE